MNFFTFTEIFRNVIHSQYTFNRNIFLTIVLLQNNYIYVLQNGTRVESAEPREDLKVHEVPSTATTVTTTTSAPPLAISEEPDYEGSAPADDFWEADYTEDNK